MNLTVQTETMIEKLKTRAQQDKLFNLVCQKFSNRQRARSRITISALYQTLGKDGYKFLKSDYEDIIKFLASTGAGNLHKSYTGRIDSLRNMKYTLQSIGQVALGNSTALVRFQAYTKLRPRKQLTPASVPGPMMVGMTKNPKISAILTVMMNNEKYEFPIYRPLSVEEVGFMLADLYTGNQKSNA